MVKKKKEYWFILGILIFLVYILLAARPIPKETILVSRWLSSLESSFPVSLGKNDTDSSLIIPFQLGNRFGYLGDDGRFLVNRIQKEGYLSFSDEYWSEYDTLPSSVEVFDPENHLLLTIEDPPGYPLFLDKRLFLIGPEQNSISALNRSGDIIWTFDFPAPLTCIDAAAGYVAAGTLDGSVELLNSSGRQVFPSFEPGGSRLSVILGCAISRDGTRLALISGIDDQRFLLLEQSGESYRIVYHEFLSEGFRRAVHIRFIDNDNRVAYEREGGIGIYDISSRSSVFLPLEGEITTLDEGDDKYLFIISSQGEKRKKLVGIRLPGEIIMEAPFRSETAFLSRRNSRIYLGGDTSLASFELGKK